MKIYYTYLPFWFYERQFSARWSLNMGTISILHRNNALQFKSTEASWKMGPLLLCKPWACCSFRWSTRRYSEKSSQFWSLWTIVCRLTSHQRAVAVELSLIVNIDLYHTCMDLCITPTIVRSCYRSITQWKSGFSSSKIYRDWRRWQHLQTWHKTSQLASCFIRTL